MEPKKFLIHKLLFIAVIILIAFIPVLTIVAERPMPQTTLSNLSSGDYSVELRATWTSSSLHQSPVTVSTFNYSFILSVNFHGNQVLSTVGNGFNVTILREIVFLGNSEYYNDPFNSKVGLQTQWEGSYLGGPYNRTYGHYQSRSYSYTEPIAGLGTNASPAHGVFSSGIATGMLTGGSIMISEQTGTSIYGTPWEVSQYLNGLNQYEKDLAGGNITIAKMHYWLSSLTGNSSYILYTSTNIDLIKSNIAMVPELRPYVEAGVVTSLIPLGVLGLLELSERKRWRHRNRMVLLIVWLAISMLIVSPLFIYYSAITI